MGNKQREYDWINDPFDEKKAAEERERYGMSSTSKVVVLIAVVLFLIGLFAMGALLLFGIL